VAATINASKLLTGAVGLTQAATVIERKLEIVTLTATPARAQNYIVFRGPTSGAVVTSLALAPGNGSTQPHAATEADTWIFSVVNKRTGGSLSKNACSLSGVTLAPTAWKNIPLNNGNSTVQSGESLRLELSISGAPMVLKNPAVAIEWVPLSNV
jgi:hypothetical protein